MRSSGWPSSRFLALGFLYLLCLGGGGEGGTRFPAQGQGDGDEGLAPASTYLAPLLSSASRRCRCRCRCCAGRPKDAGYTGGIRRRARGRETVAITTSESAAAVGRARGTRAKAETKTTTGRDAGGSDAKAMESGSTLPSRAEVFHPTPPPRVSPWVLRITGRWAPAQPPIPRLPGRSHSGRGRSMADRDWGTSRRSTARNTHHRRGFPLEKPRGGWRGRRQDPRTNVLPPRRIAIGSPRDLDVGWFLDAALNTTRFPWLLLRGLMASAERASRLWQRLRAKSWSTHAGDRGHRASSPRCASPLATWCLLWSGRSKRPLARSILSIMASTVGWLRSPTPQHPRSNSRRWPAARRARGLACLPP